MSTQNKINIVVVLLVLILAFITGMFFIRTSSPSISKTETATSTPDTTPVKRLSVKGTQILDPDGNPIVLRGFVWGDVFNISTSSPNDAAANATEGANATRIAVRWWGDYGIGIDSYDPNSPQTGYINPTNLAVLDQYIQLAAQNHLWIDLFLESDCGAASGGKVGGTPAKVLSVCGVSANDSSKPRSFMNDPAMLAQFTAAWDFLANRYKNQSYIGMYELLSEPGFGKCDGSSNQGCTFTKNFYTGLINSVHAIDSSVPFLVGADGSYFNPSNITQTNGYLGATTTPIIYTFDMLEGGASRHPEYVQDEIEPFIQKYNVPFFIQQVGVASGDSDAVSATEALLGALNKAGIGWTWWEYRAPGTTGTSNAVWYQNADGSWTEKTDWLALISKYLKGAMQ